MAMKNPTESRALFNEIKHNHFKTTTIAYTDGPVNKSNERTTIAVTIQAWISRRRIGDSQETDWSTQLKPKPSSDQWT
jgi:hypothetical protein